jgi:hypothetical protein
MTLFHWSIPAALGLTDSESAVVLIVVASMLVIAWTRAQFYRAYFFAKQRNAGHDPRAVLRAEFPLIWWLM